MTNNIDEKIKLRFRVLKALYDISDASPTKDRRSDEIATRAGIDEAVVMSVLQYFQNKDLVEIVPHRPSTVAFDLIRIKTKGIDEVETALSGKETPTEHFSPSIVTIIGSQLSSSPIQQASPGASQLITIDGDKLDELNNIIEGLKQLDQEPLLKNEDKNDLRAEIQTIQGQLSSSTESVMSVRTVLVGVSSICAAASLLITRINMWLHGIT